MGLRDLLLLFAIYGGIPFILRKPFFGILMWYWVALMNPHRISWVLREQPFAQLIALAVFASLFINRDLPKRFPFTPITVALGCFWLWMLVTTSFSLYPYLAWWQWDKVWKIMLTTFVAIALLNSKARIIALTAVATLSIGFFGFKGGWFTIVTGGGHHVFGPEGSFIAGNNEIGLALIMTVPLLFFLRTLTNSRVLKTTTLIGIILCVFAILGTQSRGALVGISAMGLFLALKSEKKLQYLILIAVLAPIAYNFMPETWHERMGTISTYEEDSSAMGRLKAWEMAWNLALHRPFGAGFEAFRPTTYLMYLPEVGGRGTDAHSIYFEVLAEHGFIGLGLFLTIGMLSLSGCRRLIKDNKRDPDRRWIVNLAAMIQVSLIGYAVGGAFLGLAYFDYYYAIIALIIGLQVVSKSYDQQPELASQDKVYDQRQLPYRLPLPRGRQAPVSPIRRLYELGKEWWRRL